MPVFFSWTQSMHAWSDRTVSVLIGPHILYLPQHSFASRVHYDLQVIYTTASALLSYVMVLIFVIIILESFSLAKYGERERERERERESEREKKKRERGGEEQARESERESERERER